MCFSLSGRIHTRLIMMIGPLILTGIFATFSNNLDYWTLFGLMLSVGLFLELAVYGWLFHYQPRWLTLMLAVLEFFLLKWIVEWPYPFELRLHTRQALEFYLLAWLLGWLTLLVLLPRLWPRWVEDGGVFRGAVPRNNPQSPQFARISGLFTQRRRAYRLAWLNMAWVLLPWCVAASYVPPGYHFTGLLLLESGHLQALSQATAVIHGDAIHSPAGVIGWLALHGRWPILPIYIYVWIGAGLAWLLGVHLYWAECAAHPLRRVVPAGLPLLVFPLPWLLIAALIAWSMVVMPRCEAVLRFPERPVAFPLIVTTLFVWTLVWVRIPAAPLAYVDEGTWQAFAWLRQRAEGPDSIAAPPAIADLVEAFTGYTVVDVDKPARLQLAFGSTCAVPDTLFRHGKCCIIETADIVSEQRR